MEVIGKSKKYNIFPCILVNLCMMFFITLIFIFIEASIMGGIISGIIFSGWGWFGIVSMIILNKSLKEDSIIINGDKIILNDVTGKIIKEDLKNIKKIIKNKEIDKPLYTMYGYAPDHKANKKLLKNSKIGELVFVFDDKRVSVERVINIDEVEKKINEVRGI